MVDYNLISDLALDDAETNALLNEASEDGLDELLSGELADFTSGTILTGKIVGYAGDDVVIDVGFKSEGLVDKNEFDDTNDISVGDEIEVLLEGLDPVSGDIQLSKRKADRIRGWERIITEKEEGDEVEGKVMRKIKGGLLVDIGVPVFLPASQVDIRRPSDIGEYVGKDIRAKILKIDTDRRNIVISRRKLVEEERTEARERLLTTLKEGDRVTVLLGGIDPGRIPPTSAWWARQAVKNTSSWFSGE